MNEVNAAGAAGLAQAFRTILVANRGEIACRIMRTARALGYRTIAVYSDADAGALHVGLADAAVRIGPAPVQESYLAGDAIIAAAARAGADAVHPGYGFLSENADFAAACGRAGLVFIGPPPAAIEAMGNKAAAKRLMRAAGVPCVPGYEGGAESDDRLIAEAERIGVPLMVKAAAGGGGRGMRLVEAFDDLPQALASARSEALNAFGSGELILEQAVRGARHVEVQVFADRFGQVIHLGERDCSIQRRHQKVIEEAPSPAVTPALRESMGNAAVAAARAIGYLGAGTVEFLLDAEGRFFFLEMNTRLQVEHPVTEAVTGLDLVEWQLRVAAGEPLPLTQQEVVLQGHAMEARLYAEDPYDSFLPQSGRVASFAPAAGPGIRIDHGLRSGQEISPWYDPMLAKVIAHGRTRDEARQRLLTALEDTRVLGLTTNRGFLCAMLRHPEFAAGDATTAFIPGRFPPESPVMRRPEPPEHLLALAVVLLFEASAWAGPPLLANWRSTGPASWPVRLGLGEHRVAATIEVGGADRYAVAIEHSRIELCILERAAQHARVLCDGVQQTIPFAWDGDRLLLDHAGIAMAVRDASFEPAAAAAKEAGMRLLAPMNGRIVAVLAEPGKTVRKGQRLAVLEAMKMQHEITAGRDAVVAEVAVREGDQVTARQLLVALRDA